MYIYFLFLYVDYASVLKKSKLFLLTGRMARVKMTGRMSVTGRISVTGYNPITHFNIVLFGERQQDQWGWFENDSYDYTCCDLKTLVKNTPKQLGDWCEAFTEIEWLNRSLNETQDIIHGYCRDMQKCDIVQMNYGEMETTDIEGIIIGYIPKDIQALLVSTPHYNFLGDKDVVSNWKNSIEDINIDWGNHDCDKDAVLFKGNYSLQSFIKSFFVFDLNKKVM